ncbi:UNVERIFIED_CONTAM: hypothetical protein PYX00_005155 [Menopon gallinae]|uniref:Uncharacterized protein n=1 Tax=Menopon gallinae TaxID=328185 RepID=A0AAW2HRB1_9NEOP
MLRHQGLNSFGSQEKSDSSNYGEFFVNVRALQCGDGLLTIVPSIIYLIGIALVVHHIITMNIRPHLYRRVGRELLLQVPWQEILILMLIYQSIRIWLSTLMILTTVFNFYQKQLAVVYPMGINFNDGASLKLTSISSLSKCCCDSVKIPFIIVYILTGLTPLKKFFDVTDLKSLHPLVLLFLVPQFMKICTCTALSFLPLLALLKLKERRPLPQFMLWMGPIRRDRSELGASGYYLERPFSDVAMNASEFNLKKSNSCTDMASVKSVKPKRLRARKSVSV